MEWNCGKCLHMCLHMHFFSLTRTLHKEIYRILEKYLVINKVSTQLVLFTEFEGKRTTYYCLMSCYCYVGNWKGLLLCCEWGTKWKLTYWQKWVKLGFSHLYPTHNITRFIPYNNTTHHQAQTRLPFLILHKNTTFYALFPGSPKAYREIKSISEQKRTNIV